MFAMTLAGNLKKNGGILNAENARSAHILEGNFLSKAQAINLNLVFIVF